MRAQQTSTLYNKTKKRGNFSNVNLVREYVNKSKIFLNYLGMFELLYEELLHLITPILTKEDTCMKETIS